MKKAFLFALALLVAIAMSVSAVGQAPTSTEAPEVLEFTHMTRYDPTQYNFEFTQTPIWQAWEELVEEYMGMPVKITKMGPVDWGSYSDALNLMLASGDLPDVFTLNWNKTPLHSLVEQNRVVNILDYNPVNYLRYANEGYNRARLEEADGGIYLFGYAIKRYHNGGQVYWTTRFDTFQKHNLEMPQTLDEVYEVAKELKDLYPESYPLGKYIDKTGYQKTMLGINRTYKSLYWNGEEYVYPAIQEADKWKEILMFMNKMYEEGLYDPEFATQTGDMARAKQFDDTTFMIPAYYVGGLVAINNNEESDAEWGLMPLPLSSSGEVGWTLDHWAKGAFVDDTFGAVISADAANADLIVKYLDFEFTDEMSTLFTWGLEGVTYTRDAAGVKTVIPELSDLANSGGNAWGRFNELKDSPISPAATGGFADAAFYDELTAALPVWINGSYTNKKIVYFGDEDYALPFPNIELSRPPVTLSGEDFENQQNIFTQMDTFVLEQTLKFLVGQRDFSEWDRYLTDLDRMGDWESIVDLYNERAMEFLK